MSPIHIFCDETGTLSNATLQKSYGFGWVVVEDKNLSLVEDILKENRLDKIHVKNLRGAKRKVKLSKKLGLAFKERDLVTGGALIRKDPHFVRNILDKNIAKQKIKHPSYDFSEAEKRQNKVVRLQEIAILATRYALLSAIRKYGIRETNIHFSAVIDSELHGHSIKAIQKFMLNGLNELISYAEKRGLINIPGIIVPSNININVKSKSDEIFGLADYFASLGHFTASKDTDQRTYGKEMYENTKSFFMERLFLKENEPFPGIFFRGEEVSG